MNQNTAHELRYDKEHDYLVITFTRPQDLKYDYPNGSDDGVFVGRDRKTGHVVSLAITGFAANGRSKSKKLKQFLALFGVHLPVWLQARSS